MNNREYQSKLKMKASEIWTLMPSRFSYKEVQSLALLKMRVSLCEVEIRQAIKAAI